MAVNNFALFFMPPDVTSIKDTYTQETGDCQFHLFYISLKIFLNKYVCLVHIE